MKSKSLVINHNKYITTPEFNKFTVEIFAARLTQANLAAKAKADFTTKLKQNMYSLKMN